ncbi:MAG: serine hydrolase domain-containing protein [Eubacteriales bacterium]
MMEQEISRVMERYIEDRELPGAALIVRKNDEIVYNCKWGYSNIDEKKPITDSSIFRIASMTKCVTAVGIMQLVEQGKISLDDPVSKFISSFSDMRVANDPRYRLDNLNAENYKKYIARALMRLPFFRMDKVKSVPADRHITIRDLLSHASGLEQGMVGFFGMLKMKGENDTLAERAERYSKFVLDFQPGTNTGYSPLASFDLLAHIIELVTGESASEYLKGNVFEPLEMKDATFWPNEEQRSRIVRLYKRKGEKLIDVTESKKANLYGIARLGKQGVYTSGSGGLFCTINDFDNFARMLYNEGSFNGKQIMKPETVRLMQTEAQEKHLEPQPGHVWGLSVSIRQDPERAKSFATAGTYGWSGHFGSHFFISPADKVQAVFMINCAQTDSTGASFLEKVEELVFGVFRNK